MFANFFDQQKVFSLRFRRLRQTLGQLARRLRWLGLGSLQRTRRPQPRGAGSTARRMEPRAVARGRRDPNAPHRPGLEDPPLHRAEAKARHHRVEGNHGRRVVGHQERQGKQCVSEPLSFNRISWKHFSSARRSPERPSSLSMFVVNSL